MGLGFGWVIRKNAYNTVERIEMSQTQSEEMKLTGVGVGERWSAPVVMGNDGLLGLGERDLPARRSHIA